MIWFFATLRFYRLLKQNNWEWCMVLLSANIAHQKTMSRAIEWVHRVLGKWSWIFIVMSMISVRRDRSSNWMKVVGEEIFSYRKEFMYFYPSFILCPGICLPFMSLYCLSIRLISVLLSIYLSVCLSLDIPLSLSSNVPFLLPHPPLNFEDYSF